MKLLSSDARNTTAFAISSGVPNLPSGTVLEIIFKRCWPVSEEPSSSFSPGVSVAPGLTAFTRMRRSLRSVVNVRARERTAALVALYTLFDANPLLPTTEAFRMIDAPSESSGNAFCTVNRTPFTLMSKIESKNSSVIVPKGAYLATPAFANTTSSLPFSRLICAKRRSRSPRCDTSPCTPVTFLPIAFTAAASSGSRRHVMKTYAPSFTNCFAVARPMPLLPPVTSAILPSSFPMCGAISPQGSRGYQSSQSGGRQRGLPPPHSPRHVYADGRSAELAAGWSLRPLPRRARARPRRNGRRLPRGGPEAPPPGCPQGAASRARSGPGARALPPRNRDRRPTHPPPHPAAARLGNGRIQARLPGSLLRHALRGGRIPARQADSRKATAAGGRSSNHPGSGRCPGLRSQLGARAPGHQAREHPLRGRARGGKRLRDRTCNRGGGRGEAHGNRSRGRDSGLHESGAGRGRSGGRPQRSLLPGLRAVRDVGG